MLRKQNSTFVTSFISEAGTKLENNDYFAYVELEQYACYVIAEGLNDLQAQSANLATQAVILAFQSQPSMKKRVVLSYLKAANKALLEADSKQRLKASITIIVTDYAKVRYAYTGNTRFRFYRSGAVHLQTKDMSLGQELGREEQLAEDVLARHEERNNLYSYLGQGKSFSPFISKKIKLENGDILTLYTRGIWENIDNGELDDIFSEAKDEPKDSLNDLEELLLSRQTRELENYTFAAVYVNKVFLDPNRKRRIKKIVTITLIVVIVAVVISLVFWLLYRQRRNRKEEMERLYENTIEYITDSNYIRAGEECKEALKLAEKLRDKERIQEISEYQKLIEAVNLADDTYAEGKYEDAQSGYQTARERSRYADHTADAYIESKLEHIADYLTVFDYIQMGDSLLLKEDFGKAEEKYLEAKSLATSIHYKEGRTQALDALDRLYGELEEVQAEEAEKQEKEAARVQETVTAETGAAELMAKGDAAFTEGDYESAKVYYAMSLDKYQKLEDVVNAELVNTKLKACVKKSTEKEEQKKMAEEYIEAGKNLEAEGNLAEAKKQYMLAKEIYAVLKEDEKVSQMENRLDIVDMDREEAKEKREEDRLAEEMGGKTVSGNSIG